MFGRVSDKSDKSLPKDSKVQEEAMLQDKLDKSLLSIGNEAAGNILNDLNDGGNPGGMGEKEQPGEGFIKGVDDDLLDFHIGMDPDLQDDGFNMPERKEDGAAEQNKSVIEMPEQAESDAGGESSAPAELDQSMIIQAPGSRKGKKGKNKRKKAGVDNLDQIDDKEPVRNDMWPVKDWAFAAQKMGPTPRISKGRKAKNWFTNFFGKTLGRLLGFAVNTAFAPIILPFIGYAHARARLKKNDMQEKFNPNVIPGWDGAEFQQQDPSGEEILADFRRVPTVFSELIAEDTNDEKGNEKPPIISILIDQPKPGSIKSMKGMAMGHSMISIEYTRYSMRTGRKERYRMQFGFYPVNMGGGFSQTSEQTLKDAVVPGQVMDDSVHEYSVGRRYTATNKQVNAIIKAASTYADEGGYSYYDRNCTTFVRDMARIAKLPVSESVFRQNEVGFSSRANWGRVPMMGFGFNTHAGMKTGFMDTRNQENMTYQRFGSKRVTRQDYDRYERSLGKSKYADKFTMIPAVAGEELRREEGADAGSITTYQYADPLKDENGKKTNDLIVMKNACGAASGEVQRVINTQLLPELVQQNGGEPDYSEELIDIIGEIPMMGKDQLDFIDEAVKQYKTDNNLKPEDPIRLPEVVTEKQIRNARSSLSKDIEQLHILLFKYFKNDKRLADPVMKLISLLNHEIGILDGAYNSIPKRVELDGDLGNIRDEMFEGEYDITAGNKRTSINPSMYEAYLQVCKTPEKAIAAYDRYMKLKELNDNGGIHWYNRRLKKEYEKLGRIHKVASAFFSSHNYMLEKETFKQQDIDYAYSLRRKERKDDADSRMIDYGQTASGIYSSLFLEKVFGGMRERFLKPENEWGFADEQMDFPKMADWLDRDMSACISRKSDGMLMIIRGIRRSFEGRPNKTRIMDELWNVITETWLYRVFPSGKANPKMKFANMNSEMAFRTLRDNRASKTLNLLEALVKGLIMQSREDRDDRFISPDKPKK